MKNTNNKTFLIINKYIGSYNVSNMITIRVTCDIQFEETEQFYNKARVVSFKYLTK